MKIGSLQGFIFYCKEKIMNKNILIGLSWPYANGELHIGHLGSSLPADIIGRYYRLKGDKVMFVSGSDCFGTPASIQAQKENCNPMEIVDKYHQKFVEAFKLADFQFENYTRTTDPRHIAFAQDFHRDLYKSDYVTTKTISQFYCKSCDRFLPDRYVIGLCPFCKQVAKGDSCDHCGKILEPEILLEPKCNICGNTPELKETSQVYLQLGKHEKDLLKHFNKHKEEWTLNAKNMTQRYFDEGLQDRAITRNLNWGVPVPDSLDKNKVIYNWAENVLGYLSATKMYCDENKLNFDDWWKNDNAIHYYVHAKDNIPFHSLILPGLLLSNSNHYHLPDIIVASEYVNIENKKISKSAGTCLTVKELMDSFDSDFVRFYFAKYVNDKKDLNFSFLDFVNTTNGELINNWGNLVNRCLSFAKSKFGGIIPVCNLDEEIKSKIENTFKSVSQLIEQGKIALAVRDIMDLVTYSNKLFDTYAPWATLKVDENKCKEQIFNIITLIQNLAILLSIITTKAPKKVFEFLSTDDNNYIPFFFTNEIRISENISPLYQRLDFKEVSEKFKNYI